MKSWERTDLEPSANLRQVDNDTDAGMLNVSLRLVET